MKKFLSCLPSKYTAYNTAMSISLNTDEIGFDEVVGILRSHEMELDGWKKGNGISLTSQESGEKEEEENDPISLLVKRFNKVLRRAEMVQRKGTTSRRVSEIEKRSSEVERGDWKANVQCH